MSSMTDIIFLLLVFFMLTSTFITPSGLPVSLPSSKASKMEMQEVSVSITSNLAYYINEQKVPKDRLEIELQKALQGVDNSKVVLHVDKSVPTEHFVFVAGIANSLNAKVTIATKPPGN